MGHERNGRSRHVDASDGRCPNGQPPVCACVKLLKRLAHMNLLRLPARRSPRIVKPRREGENWDKLLLGAASAPLTTSLDARAPLIVRPILEPERIGWRSRASVQDLRGWLAIRSDLLSRQKLALRG